MEETQLNIKILVKNNDAYLFGREVPPLYHCVQFSFLEPVLRISKLFKEKEISKSKIENLTIF